MGVVTTQFYPGGPEAQEKSDLPAGPTTGASRALLFPKRGWIPSRGLRTPTLSRHWSHPALEVGVCEGAVWCPLFYTQSKSRLCSPKGSERCWCWRRRRGRCRAGYATLGPRRDGARRSGGPHLPLLAPLSGSGSAKFRLGPPEGARGTGRRRSRDPGNLGKGCGRVAGSARSSSPRVGGMARQSGFRGVGRSVKPDSGDCTPRGGGVVVELF